MGLTSGIRGVRLGFALATLFAALSLAPASASSAVIYQGSFGVPGTGGGALGDPSGIAVNTTTGDVYVAERGNNRVSQFDSSGNFIRTWGASVDQTSDGNVCTAASGHTCAAGADGLVAGTFIRPQGIVVNSATGEVYVEDAGNNRVQRFTSTGAFISTWGKGVNQTSGGDICTAASGHTCGSGSASTGNPTPPGQFAGFAGAPGDRPHLAIDAAGNVYVGDPFSKPYPRIQKFDPAGAFLAQLSGRAGTGGGIDRLGGLASSSSGEALVLNLLPSNSTVVLRYDAGDFTPVGGGALWDGSYDVNYTPQAVAVEPGSGFVFTADTDLVVGANGCGAGAATYRIVEFHPAGQRIDCTALSTPALLPAFGGMAVSSTHKLYLADARADEVHIFSTPTASMPDVGGETISQVTSDSVRIDAEVTGNLSQTTYHIEYGTSPCSSGGCESTAESASVGASTDPEAVKEQLSGLQPATTYHYRLLASNELGTSAGADHTFTTFARSQTSDCPNNLARQQTGAALLLDCRAYELVSAPDTGGYNVESNLIVGQSPLPVPAQAPGRALYSVHNGAIPGAGNPTNHGNDAYLATRDEANQRWQTTYTGIPADAPEGELTSTPFASSLLGADADLDTFAFGGPDICNPCFDDGSRGIPVRLPNGSLVQGMAGSLAPGSSSSSGRVDVPLSADGSHLIFGSTAQFEDAGNFDGANATIYERDLAGGQTEVISTDETGATIQNGANVAALGASANGSRVVIGRLISTDAAGNRRYHLYLHQLGTADSIDLMPGASQGAIYAGMNAAGSIVYFTTAEALSTTSDPDADTSVDFFRADVEASSSTLTRVSTGSGGTGDTNACDPLGNGYNTEDWNVIPGGPTDCSVAAIGGGGGVAAHSGGAYFLSPERLDGANGTDGAPNLYLAVPGSAPRFVATLESELNGPQPPPEIYRYKRNFGSFTIAPGVAVSHSGGYVYVLDISFGGNGLRKFDTNGNPVNFTAGSGAGTNRLNGADAPTGVFLPETFAGLPTQPAVDPVSGNIYVPDYNHDVVDVFAPSGAYLSQISTAKPSAVAINPSNQNVYVANRTAGKVSVFTPAGTAVSSFSTLANPTGLAVDSSGRVYVVDKSQAALYSVAGTLLRKLDVDAAFGISVDAADDHVFVNEGNRFVQFDAAGNPVDQPVGADQLAGSVGIAVDSGRVYTSDEGKSAALFMLDLEPSPYIDNPAVVNAVADADTRHLSDFQLNAGGEQTAFASTMPLTGFDSAGYKEVFRYDAGPDRVVCASCDPTGQAPSGDAGLSSDGASLTDDGRLFFDTDQRLVARDTNSRVDAYELSGERVELISSGTDASDSRLLGVSSDGTDVLFFTRERLVKGDNNGNLVKLYDARAGGGFFVVPPTPSCVSSDECHGPGSQAAPESPIGSLGGAPANVAIEPERSCPKGKRTVKRAGKVRCVPRARKRTRAGGQKKGHHKKAGKGRGAGR